MTGKITKIAHYPLYGDGGKVERQIPAIHVRFEDGTTYVRNISDEAASKVKVGMTVRG